MKRFETLDVTRLSRQGFIEIFGGIYEHSPWVAARVFDAGIVPDLNNVQSMQERMAAVLEEATVDEIVTVLRAHPDLAGRAAVAGELTEESHREQAGAGIDACTPEEFDRFQRLNRAYHDKFGFPFIIAVRGLDRYAILEASEARLENDWATEQRTALKQVHQIAANRLQSL